MICTKLKHISVFFIYYRTSNTTFGNLPLNIAVHFPSQCICFKLHIFSNILHHSHNTCFRSTYTIKDTF